MLTGLQHCGLVGVRTYLSRNTQSSSEGPVQGRNEATCDQMVPCYSRSDVPDASDPAQILSILAAESQDVELVWAKLSQFKLM